MRPGKKTAMAIRIAADMALHAWAGSNATVTTDAVAVDADNGGAR